MLSGRRPGPQDSGVATATLFSNGQAFALGAFISSDVTVATGINKSTAPAGTSITANAINNANAQLKNANEIESEIDVSLKTALRNRAGACSSVLKT